MSARSSVFPPGATVSIGPDYEVDGIVVAVAITPEGVSYQVEWWDERQVMSAPFAAMSVKARNGSRRRAVFAE